MAYATKYLFKWESVNGTTREIRVLLDGYSGSVIQRRLGRAPVLKKQHNGNVYGTSLEFYAECTVDGEFAEFYTTDPKAYRVDLYSGNTLLWQGYITPELYAEPDIAPPYDVQVIATDGVGELKLYDFAPQGLVSLRSMLTYLLGYTGLTTDVYLISSIKPGGSGAAGSLLEKTINLDYMAGESCYEVLSYILDTLHATITWWKGAWILARETNVKFSSGKVQYFNTSGNAGTLAGSVVALGKMYTNDAWPVGQLSSKIDPAKNSVRIQAPWHPVTALSNPDMTSDTGWTKAGGAVYDSTNKGYHLPEASLSAIPRISQTLALSSLKNPMTLAAKVTGVSADLSLSTLFTAAMGFYVTYEVSGTTYHLERSDEGLVWKQGAMPSLLNYTNTIFTFLKTFDEDRTGAQTVDIEIPPFLLNNAFPAGTLAVYVFGGCVRVYGASLDVIISKGYQDNLYLDNDARGEGDEVEIAIGRETSAISPYQAFLQGILLDSGSLITSFKDDYITSSGLDFMSFIARDYARSFALPRIVQTGTVSLESSVTFPPLVFTKGALDYWLEGYSWNMLDDELDISARSLPTATITVDSETVTEAGGTASSAAQGGSSSGGGSMPSGINYFEQDDDQQELIKLKAAYSYLGPKKGLIFDSVLENESSDADLYVKWVGEGTNRQRVLYSPLALITEKDQIVGSGTPGGGGGGAGYLYELGDIYHDTDKTKVLRTDGTTPAAVGDVLQLTSLTGGNKWAAVPASSIGGVTSVVGQTGDVTASQISTAIGLGNYVDLTSAQTISATKTFTSGIIVSGRAYSGGDDEGVVIAGSGTYAGLILGRHNGRRSVFYLRTNTTDAPYWRYHDGTTSYDISHPVKAGTIALTSDLSSYVSLAGAETITGNKTFSGALILNERSAASANVGQSDGLHIMYGQATAGTGYPYGYAMVYSISAEHYVVQFAHQRTIGDTNLVWRTGNGTTYGDWYTIYHSGNSNKSDVSWTCSYLTVGEAAQTTYRAKINGELYVADGIRMANNTKIGMNDSSGVSREIIRLTSSNNLQIGGDVAEAGYNTILNGSTVYLQYSSSRSVGFVLNTSGNVTIGSSDLASTTHKLYVDGATRTGGLTVSGLLVAYNYGTTGGSAKAAIIFDKPGGNYTGIGANSTTNLIQFKACNAAGEWIDYDQIWDFYGSVTVKGNTVYHAGNSNSTSVPWSASKINFYSTSGIGAAGQYTTGLAAGSIVIYAYDGSAYQTLRAYCSVLDVRGNLEVNGTTKFTGAVTFTENTATYFRTQASWRAGIYYGTSGDEAMCFLAQNTRTHIRFYCGQDISSWTSSSWSSTTPILELNVNGATVTGVLSTTGDQVISSDINLKTHFKDITLTSEQIANAPAVSFDWKDGHGHSFGSIAQYWKPLVPEAVLGEEGSYTLAYGQLGVVLGINNGKAIFKLEQHETEQDKEIRKLREKVQRLEEDNLRLKARLQLS